MDGFRTGRSGKYLKQLLLTIAVALVAIVMIVSGVMYYGAEKAMIELNLQGNQKALSQLKYNIDYVNDNLKHVVMTQYFDNRNYALMHAERLEPFDMLSRLHSLNRFVGTSPFLHSIVMYNPAQDKYYAGGRIETAIGNDPTLAGIDRYIRSNRAIPKLRLIPIRGDARQEAGEPEIDVFAMFMYDGSAGYSPQQSLLVVNINPEWLFDNLNLLNAFVGNERGTIGIVDQTGEMHYPTIGSRPLDPDFRERVLQRIMRSEADSGSFIEWDGGEKQVVTHMSTSLNEWRLLIVQPYGPLIGQINELKLMALTIIVCFVLFAILCSIVVSLRLYRPIRRLVRHIQPASLPEQTRAGSEPWKDELHYIEHAYDGVLARLQTIKRDYDEHRAIVQSYYARTLLMESHSITQARFEHLVHNHRLRIAPRGFYRLCALQIDHGARFREALHAAEQKLLQFAIRNIAEHILSPAMRVETIEAKAEMTVLLLSSDSEQPLADDEVRPFAARIQEALRQYYRLSLTATFGDIAADYRLLSGRYGGLQSLCQYRMLAGHGAIIMPALAGREPSEDDMIRLDAAEKKLAEAIRMSRMAQAEEQLDAAFALLQSLPPDELTRCLLNLLTGVRHALQELNANRLQAVHIAWNRYTRDITELETLADVRALFKRLLDEIADKQADGQQDKHRVLVETIREMIEARYADVNLCLQTIADTLGMTPAYVSRIFRKAEACPVHDYIREVRLRHALRLLEESDSPVNDIMERVGYGNVSNFFRHFKQKYGTTPKEYRLKRSISNNPL